MKNINYLNTNEIEEFDLIKNSKHAVTQQRLNLIRDLLIGKYNSYLNDFQHIQEIGPTEFVGQDSQDLKGCYHIGTIARDRLLARIIDNQTTQFKHTCPYCQLLNRSTYDHYIPEAMYPEFSILVKNLIPSCSTCNSKKLEFWREDGNRTILHFYNDLIPEIQFLFGILTFNQNDVPEITFNIIQSPGIQDNFFLIIQEHFRRLELLQRYSNSIDLVVSDIIDDVESNRQEFGNIVTSQSIANIIVNKSNRYKQQYGMNYWRSIAMDSLANSPEFLNTL